MRCEEVRPLLSEYAEGGLRVPGDLELHLASCAECRAELASYRGMLTQLADLREAGAEPAPELLHRILALIPAPTLLHRFRWSVQDHPVAYTAASIGAAAAVTAFAVWRSRAQREAEPVSA